MPAQTPLYRQEQLNQSIESVRGMMQQVRGSQNPQEVLAQILQNNPNTGMISQMLSSGNSLENIARQMAQARGVDINDLVNKLMR